MIYPPILKSTQPAFVGDTCKIYFTLQKVTAPSEIKHLQIRLVYQDSNANAIMVNANQSPDQIYYVDTELKPNNNNEYSVEIPSSILINGWTKGRLYKVQIRFGTTNIWTTQGKKFVDWKQEQIKNNTFSEWSTVMIIKPIDNPIVDILNDEKRQSITSIFVTADKIESTLTPLILGQYSIDTQNKEYEDQYKFQLYSGDNPSASTLLEDSGWLQHNNEDTELGDKIISSDQHRFKRQLENGKLYSVVYSVITNSGYQKRSEKYTFQASQVYYDTLTGANLVADSQSDYCKQNGCIQLFATLKDKFTGNLVITRSDESTDYSVWEDIKYLKFNNETIQNRLLLQDFTIESGIGYRYAIQQENSQGFRTSPIFSGDQGQVVNFEYSYLYRDGVQLKLKFNTKLSSFKHTSLRNKQDTLGSKYPVINRNGSAYYAEFPISGTISFQADEDQTFFKVNAGGLFYRDELVIPDDKVAIRNLKRVAARDMQPAYSEYSDTSYTIDSSLTDKNFFIERKFREKVEEFLNDFNCKLFKSPSEGNILVSLINVSLTPNATLGRLIFDFSATAYEMGDTSLDNLDEKGVINIGSYSSLASNDIYYPSFGQIQAIYTDREFIDKKQPKPSESIDIWQKVQEVEEISLAGGYKYNLKEITSIRVDYFASETLEVQLLELKAKRAELINNNQNTAEIDNELAKLIALKGRIDNYSGQHIVKMNIDGAEVLIQPGKIYILDTPITKTFQVLDCVSPINISYTCNLIQVEDKQHGEVIAMDVTKLWGQFYGIFTTNKDILEKYGYTELDTDWQVPNVSVPEPGKPSYSVYTTLDIYDSIQRAIRNEIIRLYDINDKGLTLQDNGQWAGITKQGKHIYFTFFDILQFEVEADPFTQITISQNADGQNAETINLGPTGRYSLNPADDLLKYIRFEDTTHALINYKVLTSQYEVESVSENGL